MAKISKQTPTAPAHLSADTKRWFRSIVSEYVFTSADIKLLDVAATAWDRMCQARRILTKEGLTIVTHKGITVHPATRIETEASRRFMQALRQLNLDVEPPAQAGRA